MTTPKGYYCTALTGGGADALDAIDGNSLTDLDLAIVLYNGGVYFYYLDDDLGASENSPLYIIPDTNPGSKVWVLLNPDFSIDNDGAAAEEETTLPPGADGLKFRARVTVAQYLKLSASGTDKFRYGETQGAAGGYIRSNTIGNVVEGEWHGEWLITNIIGEWNYDE